MPMAMRLLALIPAGPQMISVTTPFGGGTYGPFEFSPRHIVVYNLQLGSTEGAKPVVKVTKEAVKETAVSAEIKILLERFIF